MRGEPGRPRAEPGDADEMRRVAASIVDPQDAGWNRIGLFAAAGIVEAGVSGAVRRHISEDPEPAPSAEVLAGYLEREEERLRAVRPGAPRRDPGRVAGVPISRRPAPEPRP
ncbi:MAG TPA: hypothetical protein VHA80_05500 [Solirubrobacterales bacterium]|nr:hypothetical protein [Solirubrobacterales bacterium]